MPTQPDYIPREDANFLLWAEAFSGGISLNCAQFMLTPAEAASIASSVANFSAALSVATTPATRTKGTVAAKDDQRSICEALCRQYAIDIKNNEGVDDQSKIDIGVRPINPDRERIEAPLTAPLLNILGNTPGVQTLRYSDSTTPDSRARPFGAASMQLFLGIASEASPLSACQFYGNISRNPVDVEFDEADDKKTATYYGRWVSARGQVGPWSLPVTMTIAA